MGLIKGCINKECGAKYKKIKFKEDDLFCPKCGKELTYVCVKCHEPVEEEGKKYCERCQRRIDERNAKVKEGAQKAANVVQVAAPMIAAVEKVPGVTKLVKPVAKAVGSIPGGGKIKAVAGAAKIGANVASTAVNVVKKGK